MKLAHCGCISFWDCQFLSFLVGFSSPRLLAFELSLCYHRITCPGWTDLREETTRSWRVMSLKWKRSRVSRNEKLLAGKSECMYCKELWHLIMPHFFLVCFTCKLVQWVWIETSNGSSLTGWFVIHLEGEGKGWDVTSGFGFLIWKCQAPCDNVQCTSANESEDICGGKCG